MSDIELVIPARQRDLGGFVVARVLPSVQRKMVGPFVFFDHMLPLKIEIGASRSMDVRPHPHIGLSTVTYLFDGEITHRDSTGIEQVIRPAELNLMLAGRGVSHSERFDGLRERGGTIHGIQAWVALPENQEESPPGFEHYGASALPQWEASSARYRIIAGSVFGEQSPVKSPSPLFYAHIELEAGSSIPSPEGYSERAIFIVQGLIEISGQSYPEGAMVFLAKGAVPAIRAEMQAILMLLGGEPIGPRHIWWNFVSSRSERIEQAKADWKAGRIALPANDQAEFIPLPEK